MGGMFTIVKVRENLTSYDDPGWYENPPGTLASLASNDELQRDLGQIPETKPMDKDMKMDHGHSKSGKGGPRKSPVDVGGPIPGDSTSPRA
jgi:hypothetical protein